MQPVSYVKRRLLMKDNHKEVLKITQGALIAALYVVLTLAFAPISFGPLQLRISEALIILPMFTSAAVPGLFIGCLLANILGGAVIPDVIFGSLASFLAALTMYKLRNVKFFKIPLIALLMPAIMNGIIVGFEIDFFFVNQYRFDLTDFLINAGLVAIGEIAVLFALGLPLFIAIQKRNLSKKLS